MSPKIVNKKEKREYIINSAISVWAQKGLYNIRIEDIAKEADIAKGSIYEYFKNNDELIALTLEYVLDDFSKYLISSSSESDLYQDNLYSIFERGMLYCYTQKKSNYRRVLANCYAISNEKNETAKKIFLKLRLLYENLYARIEKIITKGIQTGEVLIKDKDVVIDMILSLFRGYILAQHYKTSITKKEIKRIVDNIFYLMSKKNN